MPKENAKYYINGKKVGLLRKKRIRRKLTQGPSIMDKRLGRVPQVDRKKIGVKNA